MALEKAHYLYYFTQKYIETTYVLHQYEETGAWMPVLTLSKQELPSFQ